MVHPLVFVGILVNVFFFAGMSYFKEGPQSNFKRESLKIGS
jgi:hypothetical protein